MLLRGRGLFFAMLGTVLWWRERQVRWLASIALGGFCLLSGGNSVFHGMFYALAPLVEKARVPEAATVLFALGLAPLVAFGLDGLREWRRAGRMDRSGTCPTGRKGNDSRLSTAPCGRGSVHCWLDSWRGLGRWWGWGVWDFMRLRVAIDNRLVVTALCAFLAAGLMVGRISSRARAAGAIALVLFELGNVTDYNLATADRATHPYLYKLAEHYDLARVVGGSRIVYDAAAIPYNIGDWYGIEALNAYAASVSRYLWQLRCFRRACRT